jgi:hypothetical protein
MTSSTQSGTVMLSRAAGVWFIAAATGQMLFVGYMAGFYGPTVFTGDFAQWSRNSSLIDGYKAGDAAGNLGFISHVVVGFLVTGLGIAQLVPALRRVAPGIHRWCGRIFMVAALFAAIGGLGLVWLRGTQAGFSNSVGISLNGVAIILCAALAWRAALKRDFARHQRWAFRLWLVVNGVWFLRIGMVVFGIVSHGLLGMTEPPIAAAFALWSFGSYIVPLMIYELYWAVKARGGLRMRVAMTVSLGVLTLLMLGGIAGMAIGQWLPLALAPPL